MNKPEILTALLSVALLGSLASPSDAKDRGLPGAHPVAKGAAVGAAVKPGHPVAKGAAVVRVRNR